MKKHELLNIPLKQIMIDRKSLAKIYNLAFGLSIHKPEKSLIISYKKNGIDTSWPDFISIKYYIHNNRKFGVYTTSVDIGYSDTSGIEVSLTNTRICTPDNVEKIATFIKKKAWVKEDLLERRMSELESKIASMNHDLICIKTKCYKKY